MALFLGAITVDAVKISSETEKHHHTFSKLPADYAQINSEAFADASVQARVDADADIANEVRHHHMVNAASHNKAWKKHFKESSFYKQYAIHNEEQQKCESGCAEKRKELVQLKSNYEQLEKHFEELSKKADKEALAKLNAQPAVPEQKKDQGAPPKDAKNILVEEEEENQ